MNYKTFNLKPLRCMSVKLNILPQDILFIILVVACPTLGFLVLALTAMQINGDATWRADFKNLIQAVCVPLKIFCSLLLIEAPSG